MLGISVVSVWGLLAMLLVIVLLVVAALFLVVLAGRGPKPCPEGSVPTPHSECEPQRRRGAQGDRG